MHNWDVSFSNWYHSFRIFCSLKIVGYETFLTFLCRSIILNMIRMVAPILTTWVLSIYSIICPRGETKLPWKDVYINFILIECSKLHLQRIMICIMLYNYGWNLELGFMRYSLLILHLYFYNIPRVFHSSLTLSLVAVRCIMIFL